MPIYGPDYFRAKVYTIWAHGPFAKVMVFDAYVDDVTLADDFHCN